MKKQKTPIPSGILCKDCKQDIPKQRLDACPGTTKCVKCSDIKTKKPITITKGTGDNTYTETLIVDDDAYKAYLKQEEAERRLLGYAPPSDLVGDDDDIKIDPNITLE